MIPLRSYLGLPLLVGSEFIGTLEPGLDGAGAFREEDLDLVRCFLGRRPLPFTTRCSTRQEQQRTAELSGLAQLAQAFSSVRDPNGLFARLVESIAPLVLVSRSSASCCITKIAAARGACRSTACPTRLWSCTARRSSPVPGRADSARPGCADHRECLGR
jgi:hypothetical protein